MAESADDRHDLEAVIDSSGISRFQVVVLALCSLVALLDGFDTQSIAFIAPEILGAWHLQTAAFGPVFGVGLLGGLAGALLFGMAGDRYGRKPTLVAAIGVFAIGSLLTPLVHSIPDLIAARFATGLGLGGALPGILAISAEYAPARRRRQLTALMFCGFPLGAVLGGAASARLIPAFGWTSVPIAGGVLPLLLLPLFIAFIPESLRFLALADRKDAIRRIMQRMCLESRWNGSVNVAPAQARSPVASVFADGRAPGTILLWAALFLALLLTYFLVNWIPIVVRQAGFPIQTAVIAVVMMNLGAVIGAIVIGRLVDRARPAPVIGCAFVIGGCAIALLGHIDGSSRALLATALTVGAFSLGAQMCTVALCASFYPTATRTTGIGAAMGVGRIGSIIGPVVGGLLLAGGIGTPMLFAIAGLTSVGAAVAVFLFGQESRVLAAGSVR